MLGNHICQHVPGDSHSDAGVQDARSADSGRIVLLLVGKYKKHYPELVFFLKDHNNIDQECHQRIEIPPAALRLPEAGTVLTWTTFGDHRTDRNRGLASPCPHHLIPSRIGSKSSPSGPIRRITFLQIRPEKKFSRSRGSSGLPRRL